MLIIGFAELRRQGFLPCFEAFYSFGETLVSLIGFFKCRFKCICGEQTVASSFII